MKKRYIVYACVILLAVLGGVFGSGFIPPVRPYIQLPGEVVVHWSEGSPLIGLFGNGLTNTFIAALVTFFLWVIVAIGLRAKSKTADEVPTGFYNFIELIIEGAYGYVENAAGKWAKEFFPFFMTFILFIVGSNWMGLLPGVDSIGKWENIPHFRALQAVEAAEKEAEAAGHELTEDEIHEIEHAVEHEVDEANVGDLQNGIFLTRAQPDADGNKPDDADWSIVPFIRPAATDLNLTLAMAIISVVMTQYYGMKAQGLRYWGKFFVWDGNKIAKNPLAILDPIVGLLELVSEIFKIVSFAFRLLGNIFAGMVLLFVIGSLLPAANLLFYHLEFAVGLLQGVVFALLTLTFMSGATQSHHGDEHH